VKPSFVVGLVSVNILKLAVNNATGIIGREERCYALARAGLRNVSATERRNFRGS
jgi:hypothetical protein